MKNEMDGFWSTDIQFELDETSVDPLYDSLAQTIDSLGTNLVARESTKTGSDSLEALNGAAFTGIEGSTQNDHVRLSGDWGGDHIVWPPGEEDTYDMWFLGQDLWLIVTTDSGFVDHDGDGVEDMGERVQSGYQDIIGGTASAVAMYWEEIWHPDSINET